MQDTEKYLNSILEKRLGSVPNSTSFCKNGTTATRLPLKQQTLAQMPALFRTKAEHTFHTTGIMPSIRDSKNAVLTSYTSKQPLSMRKITNPDEIGRVEYLSISRRIGSVQEERTVPTVDVSKYRREDYIPPEQVQVNPEGFGNGRQQFGDGILDHIERESECGDEPVPAGRLRTRRIFSQNQYQG